MTNSPHVLFFRPLIRCWAGRARGRGDGTRLRADAGAARAQRDRASRRRAAPRRRRRAREGAGDGRPAAMRCAASQRAAASTSSSPTGRTRRCSLPAASASPARPPRLRVRDAPAPARPPGGARVVFPDAVPPARLSRFGVRPPKLVQYPGLEEEYYLADFEPDRTVLDGVGAGTVVAVVRTPPEVSLYHRHDNPLFDGVLERLGRDESSTRSSCRERRSSATRSQALGLPSLHVPKHAVDAQSLVALADLVVSAGGTMNREAAALGTPVYTTFAGRLGAVDEALIRDGRLRPLDRPADTRLRKRDPGSGRGRARPALLLDLLVSAERRPLRAGSRSSRRYGPTIRPSTTARPASARRRSRSRPAAGRRPAARRSCRWRRPCSRRRRRT